MCIAILNASGNTLPEEYLENSWDNNNQGAGLLWVENKKLKSYKTFKYEDLTDKYYELRKNAFIGNIVLHFRISTSGKHNDEDLHPFFVDNGLAFVHNGIIHGLGDHMYSDTWYFNETVLKGLPKGFLDNKVICKLLKGEIGYSKLLFLDKNDNYYIINEHLGSFDSNGNWFSNNSHLESLSYYYYGNEKKSKNKSKKPFGWSIYDEEEWWDANPLSPKEKEKEEEVKEDCPFCGARESMKYLPIQQDYCCEKCGEYFIENCH